MSKRFWVRNCGDDGHRIAAVTCHLPRHSRHQKPSRPRRRGAATRKTNMRRLHLITPLLLGLTPLGLAPFGPNLARRDLAWRDLGWPDGAWPDAGGADTGSPRPDRHRPFDHHRAAGAAGLRAAAAARAGLSWTPGYWAYGPAGYYWVPGTWVLPPASACCGRRAIGAGTTACMPGTPAIGGPMSASTAASIMASAMAARLCRRPLG